MDRLQLSRPRADLIQIDQGHDRAFRNAGLVQPGDGLAIGERLITQMRSSKQRDALSIGQSRATDRGNFVYFSLRHVQRF